MLPYAFPRKRRRCLPPTDAQKPSLREVVGTGAAPAPEIQVVSSLVRS